MNLFLSAVSVSNEEERELENSVSWVVFLVCLNHNLVQILV